VTEVELPREFYWEVASTDLYEVTKPPNEVTLDMGSLADDWGFVKGLLNDEAQPIGYQLTEVAPLLAALGYWALDSLGPEGG
jgi:hypothetical protein